MYSVMPSPGDNVNLDSAGICSWTAGWGIFINPMIATLVGEGRVRDGAAGFMAGDHEGHG